MARQLRLCESFWSSKDILEILTCSLPEKVSRRNKQRKKKKGREKEKMKIIKWNTIDATSYSFCITQFALSRLKAFWHEFAE